MYIHLYPLKVDALGLEEHEHFFACWEHSGKQVSGNEQCCELFGDLACPLFGRSLLGPDLTKPSAH